MFEKLRLFRIRLYLGLGLVAMLSLILAAMAYALADKSRYYLERARLAQEVHAEYAALTLATHRLFKQPMDIPKTVDGKEPADVRAAKEAIEENLHRLRLLHASEIAHVDEDKTVEEKNELIRLAQIEAQITKVLADLERANTPRTTGRGAESLRSMLGALEKGIDSDFEGLLEQALEGENEEAREAVRESAALARRGSGFMAAISALIVVLALVFIYLSRLHLGRPLASILEATEMLRRGKLTHRVSILGQDEFAVIGRQFNAMADALYAKHRRLEAGKDELEQTAEFRTEDLRIAKERLGRADENRGQFFADISHELRTPLTIIKGEAQIALRGRDKSTEVYKDSLQRITEHTDHLNRLVDDLLFIARANADSVSLKKKSLVLGRLLEAVCADAGVVAREKRIAVKFHNHMPGVKMTADADKLRQLFMILLMNAIGYSNSDGKVTMTLRQGIEGAVVKVTDRGMGIPKDDIESIFERFYRGRNVMDSEIPGSGLGLPVARAIVVAHNGSIQVESGVGEGTTVMVTLPIAKNMHALA